MGHKGTWREGSMGGGVNDGGFYERERGRERERCISVMRQRGIRVGEECIYKERDGGREKSGCVFSLFSFVSANSSLHNPVPPKFLESG